MDQIEKLCPFRRDDYLKLLFLEHRKAWTRNFLNGWMKKSNLKWSDMKDLKAISWLKRGCDTKPYCTDVDLCGYWESTKRSETRKQQRPSKRHIPQDTVSLDIVEELQKVKPQVKAEPTPRSISLRT